MKEELVVNVVACLLKKQGSYWVGVASELYVGAFGIAVHTETAFLMLYNFSNGEILRKYVFILCI